MEDINLEPPKPLKDGYWYFEFPYKGNELIADQIDDYVKKLKEANISYEGQIYKCLGVERHPLPFLKEGQKIGLHCFKIE